MSGASSTPISLYHRVNLTMTQGQSVALMGPSGCGKSTLLSMIAGLETIDEGDIWLFNQSLKQMNDEQLCQIRADHLGFVFQSFMLVPGFSASENLQMACYIQQKRLSVIQAQQALDEVGLADKAKVDIAHLSGGEQQRVAIARALVTQPQLLLADEPTGNLDPSTASQISDLMFKLNEEHHIGLLLATHDPQLAARCDVCYRVTKGELHA